jgi:glycosyltransferase involved in cell wall biosynthesis
VRILQLNLAFDGGVSEPSALLDRYRTLTGWSDALVSAGASVTVVQRFAKDNEVVRGSVRYRFVDDDGPALPSPSHAAAAVVEAVAVASPDVVHINGLMFPAMVQQVRSVCPRAAIVLQDHAGMAPPGAFQRLRDRSWAGLKEADAWSFTAVEHAQPWRDAGLLGDVPVFEILEASASLAPLPRDRAIALTGLSGAPSLLWVGRLNANKDPMTVLSGFERSLSALPDARLYMIYSDATLEPDVRARLARSPRLADRVALLGRVPFDRIPEYYSAADVFVSGSHREGSGYALIEAMSCGAIPVVTDIPSFRAIAGECGRRWRAGHADGCAEALSAVASDPGSARAMAQDRFARHLSWTAIGRRTMDAYRSLA